jgi:ATP-dependent DNA ligase
VRLITRGGYNLTDRYQWIEEAALKNRHWQFVIDGEAVVLGVDGIADFDALHSRKYDDEVQLYAFDILALDGDDLRRLPLSLRKTNLARLLARRPDGIFVAPQGEIGPDLVRAACDMGPEGLVSKRRDRPYQGGRSRYWVKVKNRRHPAMSGVMGAFCLGVLLPTSFPARSVLLLQKTSYNATSTRGVRPCCGGLRFSWAYFLHRVFLRKLKSFARFKRRPSG